MRDVGIVMPVYKQIPVYLELALRSVLQQSYRHYHFVIVSDGAPPGIVNVIKNVTKGDERVHLILKENNEGVAKTLNIGFDYLMKIEEVKYLTWVSSDNIYFPTFLTKLRNALEKAPANVGLSYSSFLHIDPNGDVIMNKNLEKFNKHQQQPKENLLDSCFIGVSFMYKKQIAQMIDGYKLEPVEDYDYWLRLTEHCEIVYIPEVLMKYRTNSPLSISAQLRNSKAQHRRWRYTLNLAKQQARNRRKIPFMLTVIYPVDNGSEETIEKLEQLLEQSFSNYKVIIIDRTLDLSASKTLRHIEDPRVKFIELKGVSIKNAIRYGISEANTPNTIIYGKSTFPTSESALNNLIVFYNHLIEKGLDNSRMVVFDKSLGQVGYRIDPYKKEPGFGNLYKTENLIEILK